MPLGVGVAVPQALARGGAGPLFASRLLGLLGAALVVAGVAVIADSFIRFAAQGRGTPAPIAPTETLVVSGLYRFVRNPIYIALLAVVIGQGLLLGSVAVLVYATALAIGFHLFVVVQEEPSLRRRFGPRYESYCREVRRWLPRLRPYRA